VSLCAQAFFARHGFELIERRTVVLRGVALANARMRRAALVAPYSTSSL
jgi:putative acetyltransferase